MKLKEIKDLLMREKNLWIWVIVIFSLIQDHRWEEIDESDWCHLILINLSSFDWNEFVADIFSDVELAVSLQNMCDHWVILGLKKSQQILSGEIEVRILRNGQFELLVFCGLGNEPAVMDELPSAVESWVHDDGHEVISARYLSEDLFQEWITARRNLSHLFFHLFLVICLSSSLRFLMLWLKIMRFSII